MIIVVFPHCQCLAKSGDTSLKMRVYSYPEESGFFLDSSPTGMTVSEIVDKEGYSDSLTKRALFFVS